MRMEQPFAARLIRRAAHYHKTAGIAEGFIQHLIAHQGDLFADLHADEQNADHRAAGIGDRLVLRDIAFAEQCGGPR